MEPSFPRQLDITLELSVALMEAAVASARKSAKDTLRKFRPKRGETLKPGVDTPLWNELSAAVKTRLTKHGEKARLGRVLGLPRQRVHELLDARSHMPDAERTLLLLAWLHARNNGVDLA